MNKIKSNFLSLIIQRTLLALVVAYITLNTFQIIQKNYNVHQSIAMIHQEIERLKLEIKHLHNKIAYYQSDSYRSIEAKRRLGLKRKGEKVIMIATNQDSESSTTSPLSVSVMPQVSQQQQGFFEQASVYAQSWWNWIFK